jgi:hypothetical protein
MQKIVQRTTMSVAAIALGSMAFAGTALGTCEHSSSHGHSEGTTGTGGNGGNGGAANANCAVPIGVSAGVIGQGGKTSQCNAVSGSGGSGGGGVTY